MGKKNVELGAAKLFAHGLSKLPVKRRYQVSLRMSASLPWLRRAVNDPVALEEGGDSCDDMETSPQHRPSTTEHSSGSDTEASDRDEENVASGYLADSEPQPRRLRVTRIQPRRKVKADILKR